MSVPCGYRVQGGNYVCLLAEGRVKSLFFRITCASGSSYQIYSARKMNNYLVLIMKNLDPLEDKKQTERLVTEMRKDPKTLQSLQQCHICFFQCLEILLLLLGLLAPSSSPVVLCPMEVAGTPVPQCRLSSCHCYSSA